MRYFAFLNYRTSGPFEVDALLELEGFTVETFVCRETAGFRAEEWSRAGAVAEIAARLSAPKAAARPGASPPAAPPPRPQPPRSREEAEPSRGLEEEFRRLHGDLRSRDEEIARLKAEVERVASELRARVSGDEAARSERETVEERFRGLEERAKALEALSQELREKLLLKDAELVRSRAEAAAQASLPPPDTVKVKEEARVALQRVVELRLTLLSLLERVEGWLPRGGSAPRAGSAARAPAPPEHPSRPAAAILRSDRGYWIASALAAAVFLFLGAWLGARNRRPAAPPAATAAPAAARPARPKGAPPAARPVTPPNPAGEELSPELPSIYGASRRQPPPADW
ncbi:MAG: hypothetical protein HY553_03405 [Elusimicrobia bacterium]|nr:hypothetical protein [Elusimicrobiota bacterium]